MKFKLKGLALSIAFAINGSAYAVDFTNGGFESGSLTGWTQGSGTWNTGEYDPTVP